MSAHRTEVSADVSPAMTEAAAIILCELVARAKPKALARAKAALMERATILETWEGCRLPAGVVSLHEWRQARASVAQRQERAEIAEAIRYLLKAL